MRRNLFISKTAFLICLVLSSSAIADTKKFDSDLVISNAFKVIKRVVPQSHPEFWPKTSKDLTILRFERNGVIDFAYTSENGKCRGNIYCMLSQLIKYSEEYSQPNEVCFRANIHEKNEKATNGFGAQVGIY